jgi:hypothetical protein
MLGTRWNLRTLFSYGEVICFVSAWALSLLMAASVERSRDERADARSLVITTEVTGLQATLRR